MEFFQYWNTTVEMELQALPITPHAHNLKDSTVDTSILSQTPTPSQSIRLVGAQIDVIDENTVVDKGDFKGKVSRYIEQQFKGFILYCIRRAITFYDWSP